MIRRPRRSPLFPSTPLSRPPIGHMPQPLRVGTPQALADLRDDLVRIAFRQRGMRLEPIAVHFQRADGLLQGFLECAPDGDRKSTRLNSSHDQISYAVFCLKK